MSDIAFDPSSPGKPATRLPAWAPPLLKRAAAVSVLGAAVYAVLSGQGFVSTDNAVVSTYTVSLRAPITGYVSGLQTAIGQPVELGTVIARIDEPRVDDQRLIDLQRLAPRLQADLRALRAERDALARQRQALVTVSATRNVSEAAMLDLQAAEAESRAAALATAADEASRSVARARILARTGSISTEAVEKAAALSAETQRDAEAARLRTACLRLQATAAHAGMLLGNGSNDVPYSRQRADELAIRLADIDRETASVSASAAEAAGRLADETRRVQLLRSAALIAPSSGMLWKLGAADGERLAVGDTAVEIVDCRSAFLIAAIPQERYPDVAIGGTARIRLSGESTDRLGTVVSVTGEATLANDRNLAAAPLLARSPTATARIALAGGADAAGSCLVGRTARVLLPTAAGTGLVARLARTLL
jgi:multidrug resistance efflux pump